MRPRSGIGAVALALALVRDGGAQQRVVVQGFAAAEGWRTKGGSVLLARNGDAPGLAGSLVLWGAADLNHHFLLVALAEGSLGAATDDGKSQVELEQLSLRWRPSAKFGIDVGRFPAPIGAFAARRLAPSNPVIGTPDGYQVDYPWGVELSGAWGRLDYRVAAVDRPVTNAKYLPPAATRLRLALGAGFTPTTGVRVGLSYTAGSYLSDSAAFALAPNQRWNDFGQRVLVVDGALTRGYFELRAEMAFSSYDVPTAGGPVTGNASFAEIRYTWAPRFFTAARLERNAYAFIRPIAPRNWIANRTTFYDAEVALGFRIDAGTLVKVSYRRDDWRVAPPLDQFLKNGTAFAVQISRGFDLTSWFGGPR